jgi:hypothetical protein
MELREMMTPVEKVVLLVEADLAVVGIERGRLHLVMLVWKP